LEVLEFVELIDLRDEYAGSLSGGQKKLLELARSMMANPKMVLLDEPGAGVNPTLMKKLIANIRRLCEEKKITFFLIEHDMDLVMNLCDPVIVMSEGTKLVEGSPEEIRKDERVLEAYLGGQYR
ncbi:MAG TPA: ATP-binding cassette domain-containing protein, partial [Desulfatiglandales bacterium]|nr:ATP-binding cassette domain-containing protein [Desulfatiglandales bacterium]